MITTIYYLNTPIFLIQQNHLFEFLKDKKKEDLLIISSFSTDQIPNILTSIESATVNGVVITSDHLSQLTLLFTNFFDQIDAAGGVVVNEKKEILFIYRLEHWDLPKGKLELNESIEQCAQREIIEETGLSTVKLIDPLTETYHLYRVNETMILKKSHWFLFKASSDQATHPQTEEGIQKIQWFSDTQLTIPFSNTYANIKLVMDAYLSLSKRSLK